MRKQKSLGVSFLFTRKFWLMRKFRLMRKVKQPNNSFKLIQA
jgi:hypothetical protein